ncbi:uncharacterized protein B0P05DRAFT_545888 [Gilbertella persicaria]|uniref:uncharacterized protein n=1 Tax=Gilbertella persicaria TaxID=101096 RepID=UPI00221EDBDB|nr:uncharacterized protein B0P05DRAFT_545888 [Gilbertella persicaria]KAI8076445.1 hypothetical protein B0P05DRAFT_545888 [Gilbertella persicaria]
MESALSEQAQSCSEQGNQYPFCSPTSSDVWKNGTTHNFVWNFNYPFYVGNDNLSLYLYYIVRYEYINVKNFTGLTETSGGIEVTVDDSWFLASLPAGTPDQNLTIYGFYLPSTADPAVELASTSSQYPRPFNFTVTQIASLAATNNTSSSTPSNTNSSNGSRTNNDNNSNNHMASNSNSSILPGWAIAVIVIAVIALLCGAAALFWTMLLSRKNKRNNKLIPILGASNNNNNNTDSEKRQLDDNQSMHSQAKMTAFRSTESVPMTTTAENASSVGTLASRNQPLSLVHDSNKLSSSDALLLSLGRNNDWTSEEDEELKRRRLGEALLQRQLEEDGTSVKHAGRFTRVKSLADIQKSAIFERPQP